VIGLKALMKAQQTKAEKGEKAEGSNSKKSKKKGSGDDQATESSPERDYENALTFIKTKEEGGNVTELEDAAYFKKLDNMLPKKADQGPEDRAKEMVKMLAWLRKKGKI